MNTTYTYNECQVRTFSEGQTTLTPLERTLLERVDELNQAVDELTGNA